MSALRRYLQGRLHRRLAVGFGATIFVTFLVVGFVMHSLSQAVPSPWEEDARRVSIFVGSQFAKVWGDPRARRAFAEEMAEDLVVRVTLRDAGGAQVLATGPDCSWRSWDVPVQDPRGERMGTVEVCVPSRGPKSGMRFAVALGLLGGLVWLGSGLMARRITRPLGRLARLTEDIGAGRLEARAAVHGDDELAHLARAINDMAARIHTQIEDQRTLLAAVSHELRTPLGHLRLLAELASTEELPLEERRRALNEIDAEVQEMDLLVGELLANSRLEFGSIAPRPLEPKVMAQRALSRAGLSEDLVRVGPELPDVAGDATLLARALSNLIRNADVHGGGLVALEVRARDGGVAFEVLDGGPGIAPDQTEQIFRPFHRGGSRRGALGLGLALVARTAEVHGGRAYAENRVEGGARVGFTVRLSMT